MNEPVERTSVTVRIAGEEHTIRAAAAEAYTRECAAYVDEAIGEIRDRGLVDTSRAAILAALSITDQYFQARDHADRAKTETEEHAERLVERIDAAIGQ